MQKYRITVTRKIRSRCEIEAESAEEALQKYNESNCFEEIVVAWDIEGPEVIEMPKCSEATGIAGTPEEVCNHIVFPEEIAGYVDYKD